MLAVECAETWAFFAGINVHKVILLGGLFFGALLFGENETQFCFA